MTCSVIRDKNTNEIKQVLAPNGEESLLYNSINQIEPDKEKALRLWAQVYTPSFKKWFGDWENNPKNSSKVIDKNGEPLVVYHNSPNVFTTFDKGKIGTTTKNIKNSEDSTLGFFFTSNQSAYQGFVIEGNKYPVFLSIKNPQSGGINYNNLPIFNLNTSEDFKNYRISLQKENIDGITYGKVFIEDIDFDDEGGMAYSEPTFEAIAFESNQIKSVFNNGNFSTQSDNIYFNRDSIGVKISREVFTTLSDKLSKTTGVDYKIVTREQADTILFSANVPYNGERAFFFDNTVYVLEDGLDLNNAIHEFSHPFVRYVKDYNPALFKTLVDNLKNTEEGAKVYDEISKLYKDFNSGVIDEEFLVKVMTPIARGLLVPDIKTKSLLSQFWNTIKKFLNRLFRGKVDLSELSEKTTIADLAEVFVKGGYNIVDQPITSDVLFSRESDEKILNTVLKNANDLQKKLITDFYKNDTQVTLEPVSHTYTDTEGNSYISVTTAIKGKLDDDGKYELNRLFGQSFDGVLESIILNENPQSVYGKVIGKRGDTPVSVSDFLTEEQFKNAYNMLYSMIEGIRATGSIVIPQKTIGDKNSGIAGTMDILVVHPNGTMSIVDLKVSKNSVKNNDYSQRKYDVSSDSMLGGSLTTKQQHSIQVGSYKRILENKGYNVIGTSTYHVLLDIADDKIKDFNIEGVEYHTPTENETFVNRLISEVAADSKRKQFQDVNEDNFLTEGEAKPESDKNILEETEGLVKTYMEKLEFEYKHFENLRDTNRPRFRPQDVTLEKISTLLASLDTELKAGKPNQAFGKLLVYAKERLDDISKFLADPENSKKEAYVDVLFEADAFVESYRGLVSLPQIVGDRNQHKLTDEVIIKLNELRQSIDQSFQDYVKQIVKDRSTYTLNDEELDKILRETYDIPLDRFVLGSLSDSKDKLLQILDVIYKEAIQKAANRDEEMRAEALRIGRKLADAYKKAGKKLDYEFMLDYKNGQFTGKYVQPIGQQYWDLRKEVLNGLKDKDGKNLEYILIDDITQATPEQLEHNKLVYEAKQRVKNFYNYETVVDSSVEDGEYHMVNDEFRAIRALFEEPVYNPITGSIKWNQKQGISEVTFNGKKVTYDQYVKKYFDIKEDLTVPLLNKDGTYSGKTKTASFKSVKTKYIQPREITSSGKDMRDPKYVKLQEPKLELEHAQSEFYEFFVKQMKESLSKLPVEQQLKMLGNVGRVRTSMMNELKKKGPGTLKFIGSSMKDWFSLTPPLYSQMRVTDVNGDTVDTFPILFTGDIQSQKKIDTLEAKIKDLKHQYYKEKSIKRPEFEAELKSLTQSLNIEKTRIRRDEFNLDMVQNLIAFQSMANKYEHMSDVENELRSIGRVIGDRKYYKTDSIGNDIYSKITGNIITQDGESSLTYQRFKKFMSMSFYNNEDADYSTIAQAAKRIQNITSVRMLGLNAFGALNNYVMGRIYNNIEAFGGQYYTLKSYKRASQEFNTKFLPGYVKSIGVKDKYEEAKMGSKYEALVRKFRMIRKYQSGEGTPQLLENVFILHEGGEYNVQSKTGIAVLMDTKKFYLENKTTGETSSVFDAYDFDSSTGELKLKEGFSFDEKTQAAVTNYIYEVNKRIHGNYAHEDRTVLQSHWLGQLAIQFKKWVYPAFLARFGKHDPNEVIGDIEGRYMTLGRFIKHIVKSQDDITKRLTNEWNVLSNMEKANMRKNLAELVFLTSAFFTYMLFDMLAEGLDDDDEEMKKLVHMLQSQSSRAQFEMMTMIPVAGIKDQYQMLKSPIASVTMLKEWGEVVSAGGGIFILPEDKLYYQRGVNKGELKFYKELKDILPVVNVADRWDTYENITDFYIR